MMTVIGFIIDARDSFQKYLKELHICNNFASS